MNANITVIPERKIKNRTYLCFTASTDPELVQRTYISRFGVEPQTIILDGDQLCAGPVADEEGERHDH